MGLLQTVLEAKVYISRGHNCGGSSPRSAEITDGMLELSVYHIKEGEEGIACNSTVTTDQQEMKQKTKTSNQGNNF